MKLEILSAGPLLTIQDAGREGMRRFGVSTSGPMDGPAMALANALCGNPPDAAALEFAGPCGSFRCNKPIRFAVTGAECPIRVDDRLLPAGQSHRLRPTETLRIGAPQGAIWSYVAFSGGIVTEPVLGSRSTHLRSAMGGLNGRTLRPGDILPLEETPEDLPCLRPGALLPNANLPHDSGPIRLILGPQHDSFAPEILARLSDSEFIVTPQRDRMAMVLDGVSLPAARGHDIVSDATMPGSIQVPGSGRPLVLMAESQTTGGYPKIATVISADLPRLAQMPNGTRFRFSIISWEAGEDLYIAFQRNLRAYLADLRPKPEGFLSSEYLLSCDLVGGIFSPEHVVTTVPSSTIRKST